MSPGTGSVGNAKMVVHLRRPPRIGQPDGEGKGNRRPPSRPDGYGVSSAPERGVVAPLWLRAKSAYGGGRGMFRA